MSRTTTKAISTKTKRPALAKPGDPLALANGRVIDPKGKEVEVPSLTTIVKPEEYRPLKRRSLREIPAPVPVMKAVSVIFTFTMLGLGDREIADALGITTHEVVQAREHSAYAELFEIITGEFINANSALIQSRIAAYSHSALSSVAKIALNGKQEANVLKASQDILDRAGTNPRDKTPASQAPGSDLRIVVVGKDQTVEVSVNGADIRRNA